MFTELEQRECTECFARRPVHELSLANHDMTQDWRRNAWTESSSQARSFRMFARLMEQWDEREATTIISESSKRTDINPRTHNVHRFWKVIPILHAFKQAPPTPQNVLRKVKDLSHIQIFSIAHCCPLCITSTANVLSMGSVATFDYCFVLQFRISFLL